MTFEFVKVFGERNCGTNFVNAVLELSVNAEVLAHRPIPQITERTSSLPKELRHFARERLIDKQRAKEFHETFGWKHAALRSKEVDASPIAARTFFLCLVRNPFSFLLSLYRKPYNHVYIDWDNFSTFLRTPWLCNERDNLDDPLLETPVELWNMKYASYQKFIASHQCNARLFRYEDIMLDSEEFGASVGVYLDLKEHGIVLPAAEVKKGGGVFGEYRIKVLSEDPRSSVSEENLNYISSRLNYELCENLYPGLLPFQATN